MSLQANHAGLHITVISRQPDDPRAVSLARLLDIQVLRNAPDYTGLTRSAFELQWADNQLTVTVVQPQNRDRPKRRRTVPKQTSPIEISVDFASGKHIHRLQSSEKFGQPLARAVGARPDNLPTVLDATAGLGKDAFVIASLGCTVVMIEQSTVVWAMLQDALSRATTHPLLTPIVERITLHHADSVVWLNQLDKADKPDVIYLDPMYPPRSKSAAVKKEMQVLQALLSEPPPFDQLLETAISTATRRVVVKRPKGSPHSVVCRPSGSVQSPNTRYDIYPAQGRHS